MRKDKLEFSGLSVDIKSIIINYVIRPTDLKNVCLTSKELHEIAVRPLYHEVVVEVGSPADGRLTSLVHPRNIGLKHIRKLDLYLADVTDKCNQLQQANLAVRMMLELMPENILEKFSWHPWSSFSSENLRLLYRKQRRMKWLEAIALDRDILDDLEKWDGFSGVFENVRKLGLYPDSREVLNMCAALVRRTPMVEKITIHASFDDDADQSPIPLRELNDSSTAPGLITSTIFGHLLPFDKCQPLALRDLTLQKINLRYAADTYCRFIDFRTIKCLRVFGCSGADSLFAELSRGGKLPGKLETLEFKHDDNAENDALSALDGFLCLVSGLKVLTVDICFAKTLPLVAGITRHARTLRELNVHASIGDSDDEEQVFSLEDFSHICTNCTQLQQLSCAFPATSIIRAISDEYATFESALMQLPNLITLNITTWPNNLPATSRLPRKIYEHLLQGMAQATFERSARQASSRAPSPTASVLSSPSTPSTSSLLSSPASTVVSTPSASSNGSFAAASSATSRLAVIAWGASDKVYDREDSRNQIIFVRGAQTDPFGSGRAAPLAVQVGWCLRKYVEPRSDVLDFALARSCRPPTREPQPSEESE